MISLKDGGKLPDLGVGDPLKMNSCSAIRHLR